MKILKICGKNLASLAGEFTVDFQQEPLASSGLFAISGPTGAGKSTLLDALCIALYDATPRLLKAGSRGIALPDVRDELISPHDTRSLLRRGAAEGYAEVEFAGNDGHAYRARWSVRRSRGKADGSMQKVAMTLHRLPDLQAIGGTNSEVKSEIEQRIGLSFDQFTRAVLLAQNEFSAFLKADDNERGELLETLTGSAIYSDISTRAYERAKREHAALLRLTERLADQTPMAAATREQLGQSSLAANNAVIEIERQKALLEQQLRWHQDWGKFQQNEQSAHASWQQHLADQQAAIVQQAQLQLVESAQSARALVVESDRYTSDIAQLDQENQRYLQTLEQANHDQVQAEQATALAHQTLLAAEHERSTAAPQLDQAKLLDAQIAAAQPLHQQAEQQRKEAQAAANLAQQNLGSKEDALAKTQQEYQAASNWLQQHQRFQVLSEAWPRWDTLLSQASQGAQELAALVHSLNQAAQKDLDIQAKDVDASARLASNDKSVKTADAKRQAATQRLLSFDPDQLRQQKRDAEARRDVLASADQCWRELSQTSQRRQQLQHESDQQQQAITLAQAALLSVQQNQPSIEARLQQAERSLKVAEAACGESVENLRATLNQAEPCPVCGALDHPYRDGGDAEGANPQMRAMLISLQAEVSAARQLAQDTIAQQAAQRAILASCRPALSAIAAELNKGATIFDQLQRDWHTHSARLDLDAIPEDIYSDWLQQQRGLTQEQIQNIVKQEQHWRDATVAKEQAQKEYEHAAQQVLADTEAVSKIKTQLAQASAERHAAHDKHASCALQLQTCLNQLNAAFVEQQAGQELGTGLENPSEDVNLNPAAEWQIKWRAAPDQFHAKCRATSANFLAQCQARERCKSQLNTLAVEHTALIDVLTRAQADAARANTSCIASQMALDAMRQTRQSLFDGAAVVQVEAKLTSAIEAAQKQLTVRAEIGKQSAAAVSRQGEALAQAQLRGKIQLAAALENGKQLQDWIAHFNLQRSSSAVDVDVDVPTLKKDALDLDQLRQLLSHDDAWMAQQRNLLQEIGAKVETAAAVWQERQARRRQHEETRPPLADTDGVSEDEAARISQALDQLGIQRQQALEQAAGFQLALAQDEERRRQAVAMMGQIEQQEILQRRWATLNDLIGSADGKKFRNFAQQFTLDVLLGYANSHLHDLSRRYRLERIKDSLALMVLDQDMGNEMRSVHSLSGGESFLVSLALALVNEPELVFLDEPT
ncbi:MAG: AAA family ATPase, partial [Pseudomonadota bacterium]